MVFFTDTDGVFEFEMFSWIHLSCIAILCLTVYLLYQNRNHIKRWKYADQMRYGLAGIMFINMSIYYGLKFLNGSWDYRVHLPFHFCFISGYLFMFALITNRRHWFKFLYFFSFAGPLPAIIFPDLTCGFDRFLFWQYFISHHFFIFSSFYCLYVLDWEVEAQDMIPAIIKANLIFFIMFCFNQVFDTNYIMTDTLPNHVLKLIPFLESFHSPILLLEFAGLSSVLFAYLFICCNNKSIARNQN